jgi:hypothetical protein
MTDADKTISHITFIVHTYCKEEIKICPVLTSKPALYEYGLGPFLF